MNLLFSGLLHGLLLIVGILLLRYVTALIRSTDSRGEKWLRFTAVAIGILLYLVFDNLLPDVPTTVFAKFESMSILVVVAQVLFPILAGGIVAHFVLMVSRNQLTEDRAIRAVVLITTFFLVVFVDLYVSRTFFSEPISVLPNVTFVLGLGLYATLSPQAVFKVTPEKSEDWAADL